MQYLQIKLARFTKVIVTSTVSSLKIRPRQKIEIFAIIHPKIGPPSVIQKNFCTISTAISSSGASGFINIPVK